MVDPIIQMGQVMSMVPRWARRDEAFSGMIDLGSRSILFANHAGCLGVHMLSYVLIFYKLILWTCSYVLYILCVHLPKKKKNLHHDTSFF